VVNARKGVDNINPLKAEWELAVPPALTLTVSSLDTIPEEISSVDINGFTSKLKNLVVSVP
jgi:hypothetical protein